MKSGGFLVRFTAFLSCLALAVVIYFIAVFFYTIYITICAFAVAEVVHPAWLFYLLFKIIYIFIVIHLKRVY